jgi:hypothetical protein
MLGRQLLKLQFPLSLLAAITLGNERLRLVEKFRARQKSGQRPTNRAAQSLEWLTASRKETSADKQACRQGRQSQCTLAQPAPLRLRRLPLYTAAEAPRLH